jgi:hypothetical protein
MARHEDMGGVGALVRHTAGMAELAINAGHPDRKHNEYLPYPDRHFEDTADDRFQKGEDSPSLSLDRGLILLVQGASSPWAISWIGTVEPSFPISMCTSNPSLPNVPLLVSLNSSILICSYRRRCVFT